MSNYASIAFLMLLTVVSLRASDSANIPSAEISANDGVGWVYKNTPKPPGFDWEVERADERAQGIQAVGRHKSGLRIQVRHHEGAGRALVSLRFDITDRQLMMLRPVGVNEMIERGLIAGGLGRYTMAEALKFFDGSSVRLNPVHVSDDAVTYSATCEGKDLSKALDLLRAYFGDPAWRADAESAVKKAWVNDVHARNQDLREQVELRMASHLAGPHAWRRPATVEDIDKITFRAADEWLGKVLARATLTVNIVGDVPPNAAKIAEEWFWQYKVPAHFMLASIDDVRNIVPRAHPFEPGIARVSVKGAARESIIHIVWPTDDLFNIQRSRTLDLLARCLDARLRSDIPARFGTASAAKAWSVESDTFRGEGQIHAWLRVPAGRAEQALAAIRRVTTDIAKRGIAAEELTQNKAAALAAASRDRDSDEWWAESVLPYASWQPFRITWAAGIEQDLTAITAAEINTLASQYLDNAKSFTVIGTGG